MRGILEAEALPEVVPPAPLALREERDKADALFVPSAELARWVRAHFIEDDGHFHNPDHEHLQLATLGFVWTDGVHRRQQLPVVGQAEMPQPPKSWTDARGYSLARSWFGLVPDFIITLYAPYVAELVEDQNWGALCALIDHELYYCGQAKDLFGMPKFSKEGKPRFAMRGHDVEEFVGVVRRWGAHAGAGGTLALIAAAQSAPAFDHSHSEPVCCGCGAAL